MSTFQSYLLRYLLRAKHNLLYIYIPTWFNVHTIHFINVSWVMEFLTCRYKISLISFTKKEWPSRKLLYFVNCHDARYLKLVDFEFLKAFFYVKNRLYYKGIKIDTAISLRPVHFFDKFQLILYPHVRNSKTQITLDCIPK